MCCYYLLRVIFSTQGSNPYLLHCRQILYYLSHQGSLCDYWTEMFISKLCRIDKQIYLTNGHSSMGLTNSLQKVCKDRHSCEHSWIIYYMLLCVQSCLTLCDSMGFNPPGSSVSGILQARILECVAISSSRVSSQPRDWTQVSCGARVQPPQDPGKPKGETASAIAIDLEREIRKECWRYENRGEKEADIPWFT